MQRRERIGIFCREMWRWFATHKRRLPWRDLNIPDDTQRAYAILVSEVMLQQTQVSRVEEAFKRFLREFPTIHDLAKASNREVLIVWRGMGYNSRAIRLRDAAREIVGKYLQQRSQKPEANNQLASGFWNLDSSRGDFPRSMEQLQSIKGIGPYTAAAIRNFAFNLPTPCVDTNIRRILHRTFVGPEHSDGTWEKDDRYLLTLAEETMTEAIRDGKHTAADWCAALMDYGSLVQRKTNPRWEECVLTRAGICKAAYRMQVKSAQVKSQRREPGRLVGSTFVPNRIFRGRIIDVLRDHSAGLSAADIGRHICVDWNPAYHRAWLTKILMTLEEEAMVVERQRRFLLAD